MDLKMKVLLAMCFFGGTGLGVVIGAWLNYITETRRIQERFDRLLEVVYKMKRRGFVPQFEIEQPSTFDPSKDIREF